MAALIRFFDPGARASGFFLLFFVVLLGACGGADAGVPGPPRDSTLTGSAPRSGRGGAERAIVVSGAVVTERGDPLRGRPVTVVDARGVRRDATSGADGGFAVRGVTPPYDLAVVAPSGTVDVALGLSRADPCVEQPSPSASTPLRQTLRLRVRRPPSFASASIVVATRSASGSGRATLDASDAADARSLPPSSRASDPDARVDVVHTWPGAVVGQETIDVHVFAKGGQQGANGAEPVYGYGRASVVAAPDTTADVGVVELEPTPAAPPARFGARPGTLETMTSRADVDLDLGGAVFGLARVASGSGEVALPRIPGLRVRVSVRATHPRGSNEGGFQRATEAWSGSVVPAEARALEPALGPEPVSPVIDGTLSASSGGFRWRETAPGAGAEEPSRRALAQLSVADAARGALRLRVRTHDDGVSLERLKVLGVPGLLEGAHVFDLATYPGADVDQALDPDPSLRHLHVDRDRAGRVTTLRLPFLVTP